MEYSLPEVHKLFRERFNRKPPLDGLLMMLFKRPVIDPHRFDEILHEKHGDYEDRGMSMRDVLEKEYPAGTADFIEWLIGVE
jgi:hypothetical protein